MAGTRSNIATARRPSSCIGQPSLGGCQSSIVLSPPPNRPDPATYSQAPLVTANDPVTWASPDVSLYAPPTYDGNSWQFDMNWFLNRALITVRNRSNSVPAVNTVVAVSGSELGIGLPRGPIFTQLVSLAAGEVRQLSVPFEYTIIDIGSDVGAHGWETGLALFVDISHPYDADTDNNHGECVTALMLRKPLIPGGEVVLFGIDTLAIKLGNTTGSPKNYALSILPNSVSAQVAPAQITVAAGDVQTARLSFTRPLSHGVSTNVTLIARDPGGNLLGGMTVQLFFD